MLKCFKHITVHGFLRTCATLLYENNSEITPKDIQMLLKHEKIETSLNIYTHMTNIGKNRVVVALNNINPVENEQKKRSL